MQILLDMTKPWLGKVGALFNIQKRGCIVSTHPRELLFYLTFEYAVYLVSAQYTPAMMRAAPTNAIIVIRSSNIIIEPVSDTIGVRYR